MPGDDRIRELFRQFHWIGLPVGVLLLAADGRILEGNACAHQELSLPAESPLPPTMDSLFYDDTARAVFMDQLAVSPPQGTPWPSSVLHLYNGTHDSFVRCSSTPLLDPASGETLGHICCIVDVTAEERFRQLSEHLPVGVYRLDEEDRLAYANEALVRILGFSDPLEVLDHPVSEFYAYPNEADAFREEVMAKGALVRQVKNLVRKSGEFFFASISSVAIRGPDGRYEGREGTLVDVTQEERYKRSLEDVPVGFYEVRIENGVDIIRQCNAEFAKMFDYSTVEEVIGLPIRELYANALDYPVFKEAIESKDSQGLPLLEYPLRVKSRHDREMVIEVNSRLLKDRDGRTIGRTGVIRDITAGQRAKDEMRALQADIGRVLHAYSSTLLMARQHVAPAILALGPSPFDAAREPTADEVDSAMAAPAARVTAALEKLLDLAQSDREARTIPETVWQECLGLVSLLRTYRQIAFPEHRPPTLRRIARRIIDLGSTALEGKLPREPLRELLRAAAELERIACLADLRHVEAEVVAMDSQVRALRDLVTTGARPDEPIAILSMWDLVAQTTTHLGDFARSQGVAIRTRNKLRGAQVRASERNVRRALSNLLHNAIKYSWRREKGVPPWVTVRAYVDGRRVVVDFENYGVPIPRDEIEEDLIFRLGYRGRLSSDRGRLGTGIGLTDARDTARLHGGDVSVVSRPARTGGRPDDYTLPYLTTVSFWLPLHSFAGRSR